MSSAKKFKDILAEAKKNTFDTQTKGLTVVQEKHFAHGNEELAFAKDFVKLTHNKSTPSINRDQRRAGT
jgi:hypothetical protein